MPELHLQGERVLLETVPVQYLEKRSLVAFLPNIRRELGVFSPVDAQYCSVAGVDEPVAVNVYVCFLVFRFLAIAIPRRVISMNRSNSIIGWNSGTRT